MQTNLPKITRKHFVTRRDPLLEKLCAQKRVLHIGSCDWPNTEWKYEHGGLLYKKIDDVATEQLGVDMHQPSIDFLNSKEFQVSKIIQHDMNEISSLDFDAEIILFGETLEHLLNLGVALENLKAAMGTETKLLISVPNAFYIRNFLYALFGKEWQHPDHKVAFTYKTLHKLLNTAGLEVEETVFTFSMDDEALNRNGKIMMFIVQPIARLFPMLAANIFVTVKKAR